MNDAINNLREALKISPDNMPLRMLLAETLMNHFQYADAEEEYKSALTLAPSDVKIKLGLATACYRQRKFSIAGVIVEESLHTPAPPPFTYRVACTFTHQRKQNNAGIGRVPQGFVARCIVAR